MEYLEEWSSSSLRTGPTAKTVHVEFALNYESAWSNKVEVTFTPSRTTTTPPNWFLGVTDPTENFSTQTDDVTSKIADSEFPYVTAGST